MKRRVLAIVFAAGLAGCAELSSTLPAPAPPVSFVGIGGDALAPAALEPQLQRLQADLQERLTSHDGGVPIQLARTGEGFIRVRLGADESFDDGSAELSPAALMAYAEVADAVRAAEVVAHVVVHGDTPADDAATDLTARRAASVRSYLVARGVRATRVRAEGRANAQPATPDPGAGPVNRRVEIVLRPVVTPQEAAAWVAP